jgi:hypothetical protein
LSVEKPFPGYPSSRGNVRITSAIVVVTALETTSSSIRLAATYRILGWRPPAPSSCSKTGA